MERALELASKQLMMGVFGQSVSWFGTHFPASEISLSINIAPRHLVGKVLAPCQPYSLDPQRIIFEVAGASAMQDLNIPVAALTRLRMKGFQLSIDDFWPGFSSIVVLGG